MGRPRRSETYRAVHKRLRVDYGPASSHNCSECGGAAHEWAYRYTAIDERLDEASGRPFSLDPNDYAAMCRSCHRRFDREHDPERHRTKEEGARQRMIAMNKDPRYHEQRVENSRRNGAKVMAQRRADGTATEWHRAGGIARQTKENENR